MYVHVLYAIYDYLVNFEENDELIKKSFLYENLCFGLVLMENRIMQ